MKGFKERVAALTSWMKSDNTRRIPNFQRPTPLSEVMTESMSERLLGSTEQVRCAQMQLFDGKLNVLSRRR